METFDLTAEDIPKIVSKFLFSEDYSIVKFWVEAIDESIGLCGDHAVLHVIFTLEDGANKETKHVTFFMKLFPSIPGMAEYATVTRSFTKEAFIFRLFHKICHEENVKILTECVPKCYLTKSDKLLVFEDLVKEGFEVANKNEVLDYETIKSVLESLAKLHASSLIFEEQLSDKSGRPYRLIDDHKPDFYDTSYNASENSIVFSGIKSAITGILNLTKIFNFPDKLLSGKNFREVLDNVCWKIFQLVEPSDKHRNVINHGDLWATNFMTKRCWNGGKICKLVDFQCARYVPPAQDVMAVIYLTTSRQFRSECMYDLVGVYYSFLEKYVRLGGFDLGKILRFEEFLESCEERKVFGLVQTAMYLPLVLLNDKQIETVFGDVGFNKKVFYEDRSLLVVKYMDELDNYKKRIQDAMEDLKEYCDYL